MAWAVMVPLKEIGVSDTGGFGRTLDAFSKTFRVH